MLLSVKSLMDRLEMEDLLCLGQAVEHGNGAHEFVGKPGLWIPIVVEYA